MTEETKQADAEQESVAVEGLDATEAPNDESNTVQSDEVNQQIEALQAELAEAKEQVLRAHADAQNARRRAEQDVEKAHKFGQEKIVSEVLTIADNLERALQSVTESSDELKPFIEGVELTLKSLSDLMAKNNVEVVDPAGEPFNPQLHQAMSTVENADVEPNTVLMVFQKGYTLHGRLVRPAMVVVSKAPA